MREHPIPQDVVGYRFHIVGNMTIKQFAEIGAGCIVAFLIYTTNLFDLIKWPLIGISVAMGAMAAFVPFEERPLDHWLITFIRVMYKPTLFYWRREPKVPEPFLYQPNQVKNTTTDLDLSPARRQRIKEYLGTLNQGQAPDQLELMEQSRLQEIMMAFQTTQGVGLIKQGHRATLTVRTHSLKSLPTDTTTAQPAPASVTVFETPASSGLPTSTSLAANKQLLGVHQVATSIEIPEAPTVNLQSSQLTTDEATAINATQAPADERAYTDVAATPAIVGTASPAELNANLPFPTRPSEPNKLVGMVLTPTNELINDAIVEIGTPQGLVARAVKTNALGQFFVTTPLPSGEYTISVDKENYQFLPQSLSLTGQVVDPIEIRSL